MSTGRAASRVGLLVRNGFSDATRAASLLDDFAGPTGAPARGDVSEQVADGFAPVADPDLGLVALVRLREALAARSAADAAALDELVEQESVQRARLLAVLGGSRALGDHLVRHPEQLDLVTGAEPMDSQRRREAMVASVQPYAAERARAYDILRVAYHGQLLGIAALDLTGDEPTRTLPDTAAALADLAAAALEAALLIARATTDIDVAQCRLAVIAMGKCGGRELNYVSDVDVVFVAEPGPGGAEDAALRSGARLATALMRACAAATGEGRLWDVDAGLRPEGRDGPLVRTVASHRSYYQRWAKTWEFQALLKATPAAGDPELGAAYLEAMGPMVWQAAGRENFVQDVQDMRRRVERHVRSADAARELKLGPGGLRDVEFSVQLLQLVHGRSDDRLRSGSTLEALQALSQGGYVGREDAAALGTAYRLLRTLEHRIQLFALRRTHLMPSEEPDLRRLGRALGFRSDPAAEVVVAWQAQAREVRRLHERLFYRPLLAAAARLTSDEARLTPQAARERLAALGFRDPAGAMRHLERLTSGVSRRAAIQRTLLPVMLGWFADQADPDAGLLAFRRISETLGGSHWYLKMLRDEGSAAERLAHVLASGRYASELLLSSPDSVALLGDSQALQPRSHEAVLTTMVATRRRAAGLQEAVAGISQVRRQELLRVTLADLLGRAEQAAVARGLTDAATATLQAGLDLARTALQHELGQDLVTDLLVIGMGRLGGGEMGYGSDCDVMFVHQAMPGADHDQAQVQANQVVQELVRLLAANGSDPALSLDATLRPEGKNGPLVRSLESYRQYYARWSSPWEAQALLRARAIAGPDALAGEFFTVVDPLRWPQDGVDAAALRQIRTLKARMEAERLPRGADPKTHLKLGVGGLSDVEWTVQLLTLRHAHDVAALRQTGTLATLRAAADAGLMTRQQALALADSWSLASRLRNAAVLWRGRPVDSLPSDSRDAEAISRLVGRPPGRGLMLSEDYRRVARRARTVMEQIFYQS